MKACSRVQGRQHHMIHNSGMTNKHKTSVSDAYLPWPQPHQHEHGCHAGVPTELAQSLQTSWCLLLLPPPPPAHLPGLQPAYQLCLDLLQISTKAGSIVQLWLESSKSALSSHCGIFSISLKSFDVLSLTESDDLSTLSWLMDLDCEKCSTQCFLLDY